MQINKNILTRHSICDILLIHYIERWYSQMSHAEQIRVYVQEFLADGEEKTYQDIIGYVRDQTKESYTEGMLSGAIKTLVDSNSNYTRVRRGVYQGPTSPPIKEGIPLDDEFDIIIKDAINKTEDALIEKIKKMANSDKLTSDKLKKVQAKATRNNGVLRGLIN